MTLDFLILASYCTVIVAASLLGGWLPSVVRMTHIRTQLTMSFVAGLMLGVALFHLLPHSLAHLHSGTIQSGEAPVDVAVAWVMLGIVLMLLMLRLFHFHQHDFSDEEIGHHQHGDGDGHPVSPYSWLGVALGLGLHTLLDGVALGASVTGAVSLEGHAGGLAGLGVFLAIVLHKPLDALSITSLMRAGGWSARARFSASLGFALLCPVGALLFVLGVGMLDSQALVVGCALAFSAGVFLCIALGDLLPEVHFHSHDRTSLTLLFLVGIALAYSLRFLEPGLHAVGSPH